jgi:hypothetical protein
MTVLHGLMMMIAIDMTTYGYKMMAMMKMTKNDFGQ